MVLPIDRQQPTITRRPGGTEYAAFVRECCRNADELNIGRSEIHIVMPANSQNRFARVDHNPRDSLSSESPRSESGSIDAVDRDGADPSPTPRAVSPEQARRFFHDEIYEKERAQEFFSSVAEIADDELDLEEVSPDIKIPLFFWDGQEKRWEQFKEHTVSLSVQGISELNTLRFTAESLEKHQSSDPRSYIAYREANDALLHFYREGYKKYELRTK